jgi:hypothetical protein
MLQKKNKSVFLILKRLFFIKKNRCRYSCEKGSKKKAEEILFKLKKLNKSRFLNTHVIELITNEKLLAFAYETIKKQKTAIKNSLNNGWFLLSKLCRSLYQKGGTFFFQSTYKKSFFESKTPLTFNRLAKKVVIKTLQLVLEAIFKGSFLKKSWNTTATALQKIKKSFGNSC